MSILTAEDFKAAEKYCKDQERELYELKPTPLTTNPVFTHDEVLVQIKMAFLAGLTYQSKKGETKIHVRTLEKFNRAKASEAVLPKEGE